MRIKKILVTLTCVLSLGLPCISSMAADDSRAAVIPCTQCSKGNIVAEQTQGPTLYAYPDCQHGLRGLDEVMFYTIFIDAECTYCSYGYSEQRDVILSTTCQGFE